MDHGGRRNFAARFSPDGQPGATIASDGKLRFWNARSGDAIGHRVCASSCAEDPLRASGGGYQQRPDARRAARAAGRRARTAWRCGTCRRLRHCRHGSHSTPSPVGRSPSIPAHNWLLGILDSATALVWPVAVRRRVPVLKLAHDGVARHPDVFWPERRPHRHAVSRPDGRLWTFAAAFPRRPSFGMTRQWNWADFSPRRPARSDRIVWMDGADSGTPPPAIPASLPLVHARSPLS